MRINLLKGTFQRDGVIAGRYMFTHSHSRSHIVRDECYVVTDVMSYAPPPQIKYLSSQLWWFRQERIYCHVGDPSLIPLLGRCCGEGNGNPVQYSCLENPTDRGAWRATQSPGSQRAGHTWVISAFSFTSQLWGSCRQTAVTGDTASGFVSTEERQSRLLSGMPPEGVTPPSEAPQ